MRTRRRGIASFLGCIYWFYNINRRLPTCLQQWGPQETYFPCAMDAVKLSGDGQNDITSHGWVDDSVGNATAVSLTYSFLLDEWDGKKKDNIWNTRETCRHMVGYSTCLPYPTYVTLSSIATLDPHHIRPPVLHKPFQVCKLWKPRERETRSVWEGPPSSSPFLYPSGEFAWTQFLFSV